MSDSLLHSPHDSRDGRADPPPPDGGEDPRLTQAAREYLHALEQGQRPDRRVWLARYPDLAEALNECLDGLEFVHRAAASVHAGAKPPPATAEPNPVIPLGDFQIVREIGRGGMGIVYEAIQLSLGRRVALKVLPFAASFDAKCLQRFRQEAQAAAQLHHTNIVPVFAVGCERGTHYYAMQLIDGRSLDVLIRQLRRDGGLDDADPSSRGPRSDGDRAAASGGVPPTEPFAAASGAHPPTVATAAGKALRRDDTFDRVSADFSTQRVHEKAVFFRSMAQFMAQAAQALEYAHQQGVLHRDIKPANLLVDAQRNLWIADFGLAQFQAQQGLTQTGDLVGTLRYASPEQVSGQRVVLDHHTDIYSLGATFYELMTLRPIFHGPTRQALLNQVLNQEPVAPRGLDRAIPSELETILLKTLNKNPAERYESAQALADDLRRFLRDEPIRATRPTLLDRSRKWARRHPALVAGGVLAMFVILVISAVSNWLIGQANVRTQTALEQQRLRAREAEERFVQARKAVDLLIDVSETEMADQPPLQGLRRRLLETALIYYQDFINQNAGNASIQAELLGVEKRVRKILDDLAVLEGAGQLMLLRSPDVEADLQLDDQQRAEIAAIVERSAAKRRELLGTLQKSTPAERRAAFVELARVGEQAMRALLTPAQLDRLEQIDLQSQGPLALSRSEVATRLKLDDNQRQMIRQIEFETMVAHWDDGPGPMWPGPSGGRPPHDGPRRDGPPHDGPPPPRLSLEKISTVLTPQQRAEWEKLMGPRFQGHPRPPMHGFPPPD